MSNMSYCRFRNTLNDLIDCFENMEETDELSEEEMQARNNLIKVCIDITENYYDDFR